VNGLLIFAALLAGVLGGDGGLVLLHRWVERTKEGRAVEAPRRASAVRAGLSRPFRALANVLRSSFANALLSQPNRCGDETSSRGSRAGSVSNPGRS